MDYFFILGCPRSGTTMLQQALNRHSRIVIPPETKYFSSFLGRSKCHQRTHVERINRDLGINLPVPRRRIRVGHDARAYFELMASRYLERLGRFDVSLFGEKSPAHTGHLWRIKQIFPRARILFIYRDGRDVALSLTKVPWASNSIYVNMSIWIYYGSILHRALQGPELNMLCVKYEDLVTDPVVELTKILDFLGLDYEATVAESHGNREGIPVREYIWKSRALDRIKSDRIGIWRQKLSTTEINILERLGRGTLERMGYPLATDGRARLCPDFYARMFWNFFELAWRLPWGLLANELLERLMCGYSFQHAQTSTTQLSDTPLLRE